MMDTATAPARLGIRFTFPSLDGLRFTLPCDERGTIDPDRLTEQDRADYLFTRIITRHQEVHHEIVTLGPASS